MREVSTPGSVVDRSSKKYRYFISHASEDLALAKLVRAGLQSFNKRWNVFRSAGVYLDETNLAASPSVRRSIEAAINDCEYFILLASPAAAASTWVADELRMFLGSTTPDHVIVILGTGRIAWSKDGSGVDWTISTALPKDDDAFLSEPKYVDLSWISNPEILDVSNPRFRADIARVVARSSSHSLDELISEDVQKFRVYRRRHVLTIAIRAGLAFGLTPLVFVLAPQVVSSVQDFLPRLASEHFYNGISVYQDYFPLGETLFLLGGLSALLAGARLRGAIGIASGYILMAPLYSFSALKTYHDDLWERFVVCGVFALLFSVAGGLGGALNKRVGFSAGAAIFSAGGLCAAALRFFYPATHFVGDALYTDLPFPVLRGPWTLSRISIVVHTVLPKGLYPSLPWHAPLMIGGAVAGLLFGWRLGAADIPSLNDRPFGDISRTWKWVAVGAAAVCLIGLTIPALPRTEHQQVASARSELVSLARAKLINSSCQYVYGEEPARPLFAVRDLLRQTGPPDLSAQVAGSVDKCVQSWAQDEFGRLEGDLWTFKQNLPVVAFRQLISVMQNAFPLSRQIHDLPAMMQAWRMIGDRSNELQVLSTMRDLAQRLPDDAVRVRAKYAEAFWRGGDLDEARSVLAPAIRRLRSFKGDRVKLYNSGLEPSDGITLWRTGAWQALPEWRKHLRVSFGVLTALTIEGASHDEIRKFCQANAPIAGGDFERDFESIALDIAVRGSPSEGIAALEAMTLCRLGGQGSPAMEVLRLALQQAIADHDTKAVQDYRSRIRVLLKGAYREGSNGKEIKREIGIPAACALAAAGELQEASDVATKVDGGRDAAPVAIVCVARAERLAGHKDRALARLHEAWARMTPDVNNLDPLHERKYIALELAELGQFDNARFVSLECYEPLSRLEVLAKIIGTSQDSVSGGPGVAQNKTLTKLRERTRFSNPLGRIVGMSEKCQPDTKRQVPVNAVCLKPKIKSLIESFPQESGS